MKSSRSRAHQWPSKHDADKRVALQSVKRKAIGSDPEAMSDLELWQLIVRCLHLARKKMGEQKRSIPAFGLWPQDSCHPTVQIKREWTPASHICLALPLPLQLQTCQHCLPSR